MMRNELTQRAKGRLCIQKVDCTRLLANHAGLNQKMDVGMDDEGFSGA
jgi:hypothetical protein